MLSAQTVAQVMNWRGVETWKRLALLYFEQVSHYFLTSTTNGSSQVSICQHVCVRTVRKLWMCVDGRKPSHWTLARRHVCWRDIALAAWTTVTLTLTDASSINWILEVFHLDRHNFWVMFLAIWSSCERNIWAFGFKIQDYNYGWTDLGFLLQISILTLGGKKIPISHILANIISTECSNQLQYSTFTSVKDM